MALWSWSLSCSNKGLTLETTAVICFLRRLVDSLSINVLHACVYIYIRQLSSFRAATLWFIDLTVAILAIFNALFVVYANFFHVKTDKIRKYSKSAIRREPLNDNDFDLKNEPTVFLLSGVHH